MIEFFTLYIISVIIDLESLKKVNSRKDTVVYIAFSILTVAVATIYFVTRNNFDLVHDVFKIID